MKMTVLARIALGCGTIILLLLIVGITGFRSINSISDNLTTIVDEMMPMTLFSEELKSTLLEGNQHLNIYSKTDDADALQGIQDKISKRHDAHTANLQSLQPLVSQYQSISAPLVILSKISTNYFNGIDKVFTEHSKALNIISSIEEQSGDLEDTVDELDTIALDYADETTKSNLISLLESIASLAGEATETALDALTANDIEDVALSARELTTIAVAINEKFSQVEQLNQSNVEKKYFSDMKPLVDRYNGFLTGANSILTNYNHQLTAQASVIKQMAYLNDQVEQFLSHSQNMVEAINSESASTKSVAESNVSSSRMIIGIASLLSIAAGVVVAIWIIQSIRVPLANVNNMLQVMSKGDLTQQVTITSDDEFGELSGWVNDLVTNLRVVIEQIKNNTQQLSSAAEQTSIVTNETRSNINEQRTQTNQILESMEQMSAAVEEVAQSASSTAVEVEKAHVKTTEGTAIVTANIQSIKELAADIETASDVINKLDEYSKNIDNVLDVIKGIAEQTNLLALNAAIEAARAGEQGRGFAVVADEVRTLASRTQESTSEIQSMIERLQSGADEAVKVMENSRLKATSSVDDIQRTGELLATITESISIINDMSTHIATATEEQASVTEEVHSNVTNIASIADQTSEGADKTLESSVTVADLSEQLDSSVGHFKI